MFLRSNTILHMPELTRTDEFSLGERQKHGENKLETTLSNKILGLVEKNLNEERDMLIAETAEQN